VRYSVALLFLVACAHSTPAPQPSPAAATPSQGREPPSAVGDCPGGTAAGCKALERGKGRRSR
jgi:hypothetical protein